MAHFIAWSSIGVVLEGLEVLDDDFEQFFDNKVLFFVEALDLRYLLIFFEVFGQLIEGRY